MFDFKAMRDQMRKVVRARYNLDKARATAARNASLSGFTSNRDKDMQNAAEAAYEASRAKLEEMKTELAPMLQSVGDETRRKALKMRYIDGLSVREIAYRLVYSEGYMFRMIEQAENDADKIS